MVAAAVVGALRRPAAVKPAEVDDLEDLNERMQAVERGIRAQQVLGASMLRPTERSTSGGR